MGAAWLGVVLIACATQMPGLARRLRMYLYEAESEA